MLKTIHQTSKTKNLNKFQQECSNNAKFHHGDSEYKLWDDNDLLKVVQKEFPDLYQIWDHIEGIQRADLGRYAVLYTEGGLYADTDIVFLRNFFDNMNLSTTDILVAPSVKIWPWSSLSTTNYLMYAPVPRMDFFKKLVVEGTERIKDTKNTNFLEYVPYTTGRVLVTDISKRFDNIKMISPEKVNNKFCTNTKLLDTNLCFHEGSTIRNDEDGSWRESSLMKIVDTECDIRKALNVPGNICQVPVLVITIILGCLVILYLSIKKNIFRT